MDTLGHIMNATSMNPRTRQSVRCALLALCLSIGWSASASEEAVETHLLIAELLQVESRLPDNQANVVTFHMQMHAQHWLLQDLSGHWNGGERFRTTQPQHGPLFKFQDHQIVLMKIERIADQQPFKLVAFQPLFRTAQGRWAACDLPFSHLSALTPLERIAFDPPLPLHDLRHFNRKYIEHLQQQGLEMRNTSARCQFGVHAEDLAKAMARWP